MWPRLKNSPHTYAHEGLESIFLFEFIELQWVQTDFLRLSDNNNYKYLFYDYDYVKAPIYLWPFTPNMISTGGFLNGYGFKNE